MWPQLIARFPKFPNMRRLVSTSPVSQHRVAIIGAAGVIGKTVAMLMKLDPLVTDLTLYDHKPTVGIAVDISHIDTFSGVKSITGEGKMAEALECAELVFCAAGVNSKQGENYDNIFKTNAEIIKELCNNVAKSCPKAFIAIITNPVNSLIPLAAEILKKHNVYDPKKLFGISKLDVTRTCTLIGDHLVVDPKKVKCEVICGSSNKTVVPIISQASPHIKGDQDDLDVIYQRILKGLDSDVKSNEDPGLLQLCTADAAGRFCHSLLRALSNEPGVEEIAFVESKIYPEVEYFASSLLIGAEGVKKFQKLPELSDYEKSLLEKSVKELKANIAMGVSYANSVN